MWSILERGTKILSLFWNKQSTKKTLHLFKTNKALKNRIGKAKAERDRKGEGINKLKKEKKREMLTDALRVLVYEIFLETFYRKKNWFFYYYSFLYCLWKWYQNFLKIVH